MPSEKAINNFFERFIQIIEEKYNVEISYDLRKTN